MFKLLILFLVACILGAGFLFVDYQSFISNKINVPQSETIFTVVSGDNIQSVAKHLAEQNIIKKPFYFAMLGRLSGKAHALKVGDYQLTNAMNAENLLDLLVSGKVITFNIQFIEGWQFSQYIKTLAMNSNINHTLANVPMNQIMAKIGMPNLYYEGLFFPETYKFSKNAKDVDILKQAYNLMQKNLAEAWNGRDKEATSIIKTPYELLIMASLIEKETGIKQERNEISGVFYRRLAKNMMLQTDPTVIYGMQDSYNGHLYYKDLKIDTPYNTYTRAGLPPTPIAMPSKSSLLAAAHPSVGNSLYFVANGKGGHVFSDSFQQHLKRVKDYRKLQKIAAKNSAKITKADQNKLNKSQKIENDVNSEPNDNEEKIQ